MILLLDAGNTRIKWASLRAGALTPIHSAAHRGGDALEVSIAALRAHEPPRRIVACSVLGGAFAQGLDRWAQSYWDRPIDFITPSRSAYGLQLAYEAPHTLGADRFAAAVAARRRFPGGCVVVGCGTAVTFDAIAETGRHLGGLIFPGLELMRVSLSARAPGIPLERGSHDKLFATTTADALASGCRRALVAAIVAITEDMVAAMPARGDGRVERVVTGGDGAHLEPGLPEGYRLQPGLTIEGLAIVAEA